MPPRKVQQTAGVQRLSWKTRGWLLAALVGLTAFVYAPVRHHEFVNFDDPTYVSENPQVSAGLTWQGIKWAAASEYAGNWHPLTWLSHMLDVELYGLDAGRHHVTSALMHVATTIILFLVLHSATGAAGRSAMVAALFAVHPLHVESVAWVAERKDVLSTLFWALAIASYVAYVRQPRAYPYILLVLFHAAGLLAKPMVVTLPFALLLLDWWPLRRIGRLAGSGRLTLIRLVLEKLPLFLLAATSGVITFLVQQQAGAIKTLETLPWDRRVANAIVGYITYLSRTIWPVDLAPIYPYAASLPPWPVVGALAGLLVATGLALRAARRRPYVPVGWLWYLGTLVPVIGLIQVGGQPTADRYTYVPLIGVFIAVAWGGADLLSKVRSPLGRRTSWIAATVLVVLCAATARRQVAHWQDSVRLWQHAIQAVPGNYRAHVNLGHALIAQGRTDEAIAQYADALRVKPDFAEAHNRLGQALADRGDIAGAIASYRAALHILPDYVDAHNNLGLALTRQAVLEEAVAHFSEAIRLDPLFAAGHSNLGVARARQGRLDDAIRHFMMALEIAPDSADARVNLAFALTDQGRGREALPHYAEALKLRPNDARARHGLALALADQGRLDEAIASLREAVRLEPRELDFQRDLAVLLSKKGR
jgi:tetratricopeptide (TPR) repeat protein